MESLEASLSGRGAAADYAEALLARLDVAARRVAGPDEPSPAARWARSGAMSLTGHAQGPPLPAPGPLASCAEGALLALRALGPVNGAGAALPSDGGALLGEHAACLGHTRKGRLSPGGSCRLLPAADGWIALNLARPDDTAALPALLECDAGDAHDPWALVAREVARRPRHEWVERGRWLSIPLAAADPPDATPPDWLRRTRHAGAGDAPARAPRVVDLSSLWAGPLCTSLLAGLGAQVAKVESTGRPDGLREGSPRFFDLLNGGKRSVALDLADPDGRRALRALVDGADLVVEATRPRALRQLGVDAEGWLGARPGRVWLSLTGYGRGDAAPGRVAFGDDAAVAAGLAWATGRDEGAPLFCADAVADPLAGLHAALAAWSAWRSGGGVLLDLALRDVAAHALGFEAEPGPCDEPAAAPRARAAAHPARPFGADTRAALAEVGVGC
ncbi:MAG: CoA transferase [Myxococcota bacterium]